MKQLVEDAVPLSLQNKQGKVFLNFLKSEDKFTNLKLIYLKGGLNLYQINALL